MEEPTPVKSKINLNEAHLVDGAHVAGAVLGRHFRIAVLVLGQRHALGVDLRGGLIVSLQGTREEAHKKAISFAKRYPLHSYIVVDPDDDNPTKAIVVYELVNGLPQCWRLEIDAVPTRMTNPPTRIIGFLGLTGLSTSIAMGVANGQQET